MPIKYAFACNKILTNGTMDINPHGWRAKWAAGGCGEEAAAVWL